MSETWLGEIPPPRRPLVLDSDEREEQRRNIVSVPIEPDAHGTTSLAPGGPVQKECGILTVMLFSATGLTPLDDAAHPDRPPLDFSNPNVHKKWTCYAIVEQDGDQVSADAHSVGATHGMQWDPINKPFRFDVFSRPCNAVLHILARSDDQSSVIRLGRCSLGPFFDPGEADTGTITILEGTGKVDVKTKFEWRRSVALEDHVTWRIDRSSLKSSLFNYATNLNSYRVYLMTTISLGYYRPGSVTASRHTNHLAPVRAAFRCDKTKELHLLSPVSGGGHLFAHVQRQRRLDLSRAQRYICQLVSLLDGLHAHELPVTGSLLVEGIMLDAFGTICVFAPSFFTMRHSDGFESEIPAPESIREHPSHQSADWWTVGIVLSEMLSGMPSFSKMRAMKEGQKDLLDKTLNVPSRMSSAAEHLVSQLLEKNPLDRLGAHGGGPGVMAHKFFHDIDWLHVGQQTPTNFRAIDPKVKFTTVPFILAYQYSPPELDISFGLDDTCQDPVSTSSDESDGTEIETETDTISNTEGEMDRLWQSQFIKQKRFNEWRSRLLEAIERQDGGLKMASRVLEHPAAKEHLNSMLLVTGKANSTFTGFANDVPMTPLDYAVHLGRTNLVALFLARGADANLALSPVQGPPLIRAARKGSVELVEILSTVTTRIARIRALCAAIDGGSVLVAAVLLSNGTPCVFEETDCPLPDSDTDYRLPEEKTMLSAAHFVPPLVRAVRAGNAEMVRLLVAHGAETNSMFHDLCPQSQLYSRQDHLRGQRFVADGIVSSIFCGRPIEFAMEAGNHEIVQMLLEAGADIDLPHEYWRPPPQVDSRSPVHGEEHICLLIPRPLYLKNRAGLEAAVRRWRKRDDADESLAS